MQKSTWITAIVLLGAVAVAVILEVTKAEPAPVVNAVAVPVRVSEAQRQALPGAVVAGGFMRARVDVTVSAERAGRVVALPVAEGKQVQAGAVVARLDDTAVKANLERARAVARELQLDAAAPAVEVARAVEALRLAEHEFELRRPHAPITGLVELHHVDVGEYVRSGTPLLDVVDVSTLILDVDVDAEAVVHLRVGGTAEVEVRAVGGDARGGRITRVSQRASPTSRRFRVEVGVAAGGDLRAGMFAEARFALPAGPPAIHLPKSAVRELRGQSGVYLLEGAPSVVAWRPVRVHEVHHRPDLWRVEGVEAGARVVVEGFAGLREGSQVEATR
ncbi:MAG: efflux RND transporter periplasmic adaptor subunit [Planctomycetota bacterium]|nr:efflux RND transporter periplasmic adaptor subunit [Planctomycetota bacterium]